MFEPIASLLGTLIGAFQSLRLSDSRKRQLGKHLLRVHTDLEQLVSNGRTILNRLDRHRKSNTIDLDSLMRQLLNQQLLATRILSTLRTPDCRNILRIKVPSIRFLYVAADFKMRMVTVLLDEIDKYDEATRAFFDPVEPSKVISFLTNFPPEFVAPPIEKVTVSRKNLDKIDEMNHKLREFLASSFDVEHLL